MIGPLHVSVYVTDSESRITAVPSHKICFYVKLETIWKYTVRHNRKIRSAKLISKAPDNSIKVIFNLIIQFYNYRLTIMCNVSSDQSSAGRHIHKLGQDC